MLGANTDLLNQALWGRDNDARAFAVRNFNNAGSCQGLERFADGRSTYAVVLHQIPLCGKLFARSDLATADALGKPV